MAQESAAKARKLNAFRRRLPHCSASALGAILQAVQDTGLPEGGVGRDALRAARDYQCNEETSYGSLIEHIWVKTSTGEWHAIPICNPFAFLLVAVRDCCQFSSFLLARLQDHPSTPDNPWTLLIYSDEVTPGNPLATMNNRKFHAVYWSFLELGRNALSNEEGWFTILLEYSIYVSQAQGGLSQVFGQLIKVFFDESGHNFKTAGILLKFPSCSIRLWATLGGILQDGGAHKAVWHNRGDGASMCCIRCLNLCEVSSHLCEEDDEDLLVSNVIKSAELVPATSANIRNKVRHLEAQYNANVGAGEFVEMQQALGMTYHPMSILLDRSLDEIVDPCKIFIHDWMHGLFVGGVWNIVLYLFLEMFINAGVKDIYTTFSNFIAGWSWPGRINGAHLHEIFEENRKDKHRAAKRIKAQASDMLSIVGVTKMFIVSVVLQSDFPFKPQSDAVLALVWLVDLIVAVPTLKIHPSRILAASEDFLEKFVSAWGHEWTIPKFHWLLHFHQQLLLNCFCLERKHRVPKRYAGDLKNTSRDASKSLLMEVICHHLGQLADSNTLNFKVGLVNGHACTKKLSKSICDMLDVNVQDVHCSIESRFNGFGTCRRHDLVLFKDGAAVGVAKIVLHYAVHGVPVSAVSMFNYLCGNDEQGWSIWKEAATSGNHELIETECIITTLVYCKLQFNKIKVIMPLGYR